MLIEEEKQLCDGCYEDLKLEIFSCIVCRTAVFLCKTCRDVAIKENKCIDCIQEGA